jgi:pimeloyl-ACP methyl ester carboxylesterase
VYFEESGSGIPLLLQHTAGADARQWRHLLEDADLRQRFRMIAYDLPYHGKSVPPESERWWAEPYRLTKRFLMQVPLALASALDADRPVSMGSSIGGHLAVDLALHHPAIGNDFKAHLMYGLMSPTSPERYRRETTWVYSQGAPAVFKGDLYY